MLKKFLKLDLQLFDGEAASSDSAAGNTAGSDTVSQSQSNIPWEKLGEDNPYKDAEPAETEPEETDPAETEQEESSSQEEAKRNFEELIKGEYAEDYKNTVSKIVQDRLKNVNSENSSLKKQIGGYMPVLEMIANRYGVDVNDLDGIRNAVENDESYFSQKAADNGTSVSEEKSAFQRQIELQRLSRENQTYKQQLEQRNTVFELNKQGQELKSVYPEFDLQKEIQNPDFCKALQFTKMYSENGVEDVRKAYEMTHLEDLRNAAVTQTAKQVRQAVTNDIVARQYLPSENGNTRHSGQVAKKSVETMTPEEIQKLVDDQRNRGIPIKSKLL